MYIQRHLETQIERISRSWPVILLTGPRQSGKTTLLQHLIDQEPGQRAYVSLDDPNNLELAKQDPKLFFEFHRPPILVDEVQYAPQLFREIKRLSDLRQQPGDFWLTGSQVFSMMEGVQESLAGRAALLHLSPLSQREILGHDLRPFVPDLRTLAQDPAAASAHEIFKRLWNGSMPGLISGARTDRDIFYASYIATYLQRDVRELAGNIESLKFGRFLRSAAARAAQVINYEALAADAEIHRETAKSWLNILERLGIIFLLQPYSNNILKRTTKKPKLYFYDTGLVCYLCRWLTPETAEAGVMNGALVENFAVSEIMKGYQNAGLDPALSFYRDRDGKEIDLIMERDGALLPVEIKKTASPDRRLFKTFEILSRANQVLGTGSVLCLADHAGGFAPDQLVVPIGSL